MLTSVEASCARARLPIPLFLCAASLSLRYKSASSNRPLAWHSIASLLSAQQCSAPSARLITSSRAVSEPERARETVLILQGHWPALMIVLVYRETVGAPTGIYVHAIPIACMCILHPSQAPTGIIGFQFSRSRDKTTHHIFGMGQCFHHTSANHVQKRAASG